MSTVSVLSRRGLAARTGRGVTVAVIDSGIHAEHPHVNGISGGVGIDEDGAETDDVIDRLGHGTAVAAAIREKAPDVELLAVKVFDRRLTTTGAALVDGITWAAAKDVHLINLSLGTENQAHADALSAAVAQANELGAIVVAAAPQKQANWLPGALPGVVVVDVDWMCPRDECRVLVREDGSVRLRASGYPRPIPGVAVEQNLSGLSFAVANASGFLSLLLERPETPGNPVRGLPALTALLMRGSR
jgi:subtilisin family serine protease